MAIANTFTLALLAFYNSTILCNDNEFCFKESLRSIKNMTAKPATKEDLYREISNVFEEMRNANFKVFITNAIIYFEKNLLQCSISLLK